MKKETVLEFVPRPGRRTAPQVLLVDDDAMLLKLSRTRLVAAGYQVHAFSTAGEAIEAARQTCPDIILSDVAMAETDGFAFCSLVRADAHLRDVPVVLMTATVRPEYAAMAVATGASSLVERTADFRAELAALTYVLNKPVRRAAPPTPVDLNQQYRALIENIPDVVWSATPDGTFTFVGPNAERICGYTAQELMDAPPDFWFSRVHREDVAAAREALRTIAKGSAPVEYRWRHKDGRWLWLRSSAGARTLDTGGVQAEGTFADITDHKRLEEQLRQSQKMEAVGRLTGGIAHDFNNLLTVILGNGELLRDLIPDHDPRRTDLDAVLDAGRRAAGLTRQLLAFSRRQVLEPRILDIRQIVRDMEKMLQRLIGEDIALAIVEPESLHLVRADAGQLEQVIMNLAVNARDAMPRGGRLTIETMNVELEAERAAALSVAPGAYVALSVSDSGCGMTDATLSQLFEPFFTTKDRTKGTGLGLSTCYGIVRQSNGAIGVVSEPGHGSSFTVYLPRTAEAARPAARAALNAQTLRGTETVLLVEDNVPLRTLTERILTGFGYRVLSARDGDDAVALAAGERGPIDLVLCDVVMPGMSGPEIVGRIQRSGERPPRVLFMSGYTDHALLTEHRIDLSVNFIQKPFVPLAIGLKIREVLDGPPE